MSHLLHEAMVKPANNSIVAILAIVFTLAFTCQSGSTEDKQPKIKSKAETILRGISELQAHKVILQQTKDLPPPVEGPHSKDGKQTVFEWKGVRYTLWVWNWLPNEPGAKPTPWARIYYRKIGSLGDGTLTIIGDANLDGVIDDGMLSTDEKAKLPDLVSSVDFNNTTIINRKFSPNAEDRMSAEDKVAALKQWQLHYDEVLAKLADFLKHSQRIRKTARR